MKVTQNRRPMTRDELQRFLDYADAQVERLRRLGRKGAAAAYRDATVFKVIYGWGLRCNEASRLDKADFYRNPKSPEFGRFGQVHVRVRQELAGKGAQAAHGAECDPMGCGGPGGLRR